MVYVVDNNSSAYLFVFLRLGTTRFVQLPILQQFFSFLFRKFSSPPKFLK